MGARDASVESYRDLDNESGQLSHFEAHIKLHGPCTRAMAGKALNYPANVYSARINRLLAEGTLFELPEKAPCKETGVRVNWVVHKDRITLEQLQLNPCDGCRNESAIFSFTKICCAARYVLFAGGNMDHTAEVMARKHGHDLTRIRMVMSALQRAKRKKMLESSNEARGA